MTWQQVVPPAPDGLPIGARESGFAAFTHTCDDFGFCVITGAASSFDGLSWRITPAQSGTFDNSNISSITGYGNGFVGVGALVYPSETPAVAGADWLSDAGLTWRLAQSQVFDAGASIPVCEGSGGYQGGLAQVASVGDTLVAVGNSWTQSRPCHPKASTVLLTSADAINWTSVSVPDDIASAFDWLLLGGDQFLLSSRWTKAPDGKSRIWHSGDGTSWESTVLDAPLGAEVGDLVRFGNGYLAIGAAFAGSTSTQLIWTSPDGVAWQQVMSQELPDGGQPFQTAAAAGGIVVGLTIEQSSVGQFTSVETSNDGVHWSEPDLSTFANVTLDRILADGESFLAAGEVPIGAQFVMFQARVPD